MWFDLRLPWKAGAPHVHLRSRARFPRRPWLDVVTKIDREEPEVKDRLAGTGAEPMLIENGNKNEWI